MTQEEKIRALAHEAVDRADVGKLQAILELLDEEYFSEEEIAEINALSASSEWTDWREVRDFE